MSLVSIVQFCDVGGTFTRLQILENKLTMTMPGLSLQYWILQILG
jgi:hypothetical protein